MKKNYLFLALLLLLYACGGSKESVDTILYNGKIYTVDSAFSLVQAVAIKNGKFVALGKSEEVLARYEANQMIDLAGKSAYPGFFDAHCHFYGYAMNLQAADLFEAGSFEEILERLKVYRQQYPEKNWILGRGWDQNLWKDKRFPNKEQLDVLFPDVPVFLTRIDGHAALVNQKALDLAGIKPDARIEGGSFLKENGKLTGVLIDNAMKLVSAEIPSPSNKEIEAALLEAQKRCFAVGLTSLADAGLDRRIIELIDQMQRRQALQIRLYAMVSASPQNLEYYLEKGAYKTDFLNVRSFKIYADGALGSRGACLIEPYHDKPQEIGFLLKSPQALDSLMGQIHAKGFQANTHCIGDSANRLLLNIYAKYLSPDNDLRWRIEHAQVVNQADLEKFKKYRVIPSVQPTHCTSDMYWAEERLGPERVKEAYAYRDLLRQSGLLALGSDFPVEDINPLFGFHSAVARQDAKNYPEGGFQKENAISREEALRGMTIWAAYANFEEKEKGSIEIGKMADLVVLEQDLMLAPENTLRNIKIEKTIVAGRIVFEAGK
jgi:predicted amidohydrolase YtcJ